MIYTADELNNADRDELIGIILSLQKNIARMTQNQELILEQIAILRGQRFGRHSEKMNVIDGQMSLFLTNRKPQPANRAHRQKNRILRKLSSAGKRSRKGNVKTT
ncbi:hypothetical protein C823_002200 [Eubacterium plexicaudatum ASF492]|nr:hypothetical protein C823_002200 [Eubacterium plexicaudatum ASF492]